MIKHRLELACFYVQRNVVNFNIMMWHHVKLLKRPKQLKTAQATQISSAQVSVFPAQPSASSPYMDLLQGGLLLPALSG
jgi:hypothetical protein